MLCAWLVALVFTVAAQAQVSDLGTFLSDTTERLADNHWKLTGQVEIARDDLKLFAQSVDFFADTKQLQAAGNVVFTQTNQRISADRLDFDLDAQTGTFYNASGIMGLGVERELQVFGTQEPDVYFYGQTIEKIGPKRYRITRGGFTTCVQPSPRWELTSGTVVLNLDEYAVLKNSLFKVKGVPVLYLPVFYYPINKEDRATGFLIPQYGMSTVRGQTLSNAFFWAINRSHDATFMHDLFSRTGQGTGGEYRYILAPGSDGNARFYLLNEHEATYKNAGGTTVTPGRQSYQIQGAANQYIGAGFRARGRMDYFSNITVQQTYNTDIYRASQRSRTMAGAVTGTWQTYSLTAAYDRSETFFGTTSSTLNGGTPRVTVSRADRPVGRSPVYVSLNTDYSHLVRESHFGATLIDNGLDRVDVQPLVRVPFTRWPFLTINSSVAWRNTFWSESLAGGTQIDDGLSRRYFDFQTQLVGPVFTRIWDTPNNGYAQRFKHSIEPFFNLQRRTTIDPYDRIVKLDAVDTVIGKTTRYTYGVNNRLYARRQEGSTTSPAAREIASVAIAQTYYTDARAAQVDEYYRTSFVSGVPPSHLSPVSIVARVAPTLESSGTFRADYDTQFWAFRQLGADATIVLTNRLQSTVGWSQKRFIKKLPGFNDPGRLDHFLNQSTLVHSKSNRVGGLYTFNYDVRLHSFLQQRIMGYYNAQCCGFSVEYQTFDLSRLAGRVAVTQDRRFNFSFTLAGIGSFSNFFGALGGGLP